MARRIREFDWSPTLGPPARWPATLKAMVRTALTTQHPMFIFWGEEHICLYNDPYSASLGPEKHPGILGARGEDAWPETWELIGPQVDLVMRGEGATWHENQLIPIRRHGALQDVYWTYSYGPIEDEGAPTGIGGVLVICTETTAQVAASRRLREKEEQLRLATEAAEIGLWDVDLVSDTLFWPPRVKAMFGIAADTPVSMADFYAGLHPDDREATTAAFLAATEPSQRALYDVEYRTVGQLDRRVRWVAAKGRGIFDENDRCVRVIGTAIDITARKADEVRLRELNEDLEKRVTEALAQKKVLADIVEGTDVFVQVADLDYRWMAINKAAADEFERIFGVRPQVGASMLEVLRDNPQHQADVAAVWGRALAGEEFVAVGEFGDPARDRRHYEMKYNVLYDAGGRRIGAYQFVYDVTERVRSQQRLARAEESLRQAQKMEALGQLTGGIAHDFNNILQALQGALQLIQLRPQDPRVQSWANNALQSVRRGADVTARLLTFARQRQIEPRPVIAAQVVEGMRDMLKHSLGPLVDLRLDLQCEDGTITVDPTQLEVAILNLAVNARDAIPSGGAVTISVRLRGNEDRPDLAPGRYVEIEVRDTGEGMTAEVAARAFDPFFTTKDIGKGTGLGLSQVYGMARQAGGSAFIRSEAGEGTAVSLFLPLADRSAHEPARADGRAPMYVRVTPSRVLAVDDDDAVRAALAASLQVLGHHVLAVGDGAAALLALETFDPDVMVVDYAMPEMNGAQVADLARRRKPGLPVVFASGHADLAAIQNVAGASTTVLRKPFALDDLEGALRSALRP